MTIRVVARIRPAQQHELEKDIIVKAASINEGTQAVVKIPNVGLSAPSRSLKRHRSQDVSCNVMIPPDWIY